MDLLENDTEKKEYFEFIKEYMNRKEFDDFVQWAYGEDILNMKGIPKLKDELMNLPTVNKNIYLWNGFSFSHLEDRDKINILADAFSFYPNTINSNYLEMELDNEQIKAFVQIFQKDTRELSHNDIDQLEKNLDLFWQNPFQYRNIIPIQSSKKKISKLLYF